MAKSSLNVIHRNGMKELNLKGDMKKREIDIFNQKDIQFFAIPEKK